MSRALYPGSFDPLTHGHLDVIQRVSSLFDHLRVTVFSNPEKPGLFRPEERAELIRLAVGHLRNVSVDVSHDLLVRYAKAHGLQVIVRGLRASQDFDYEGQMTLMNRRLDPDIETIFLLAGEHWTYVSSSLIKELAQHRAPLTGLVPPPVERALHEKFGKEPQDGPGRTVGV